ncbi:EAL domain-containing protein [Simiduia sp. 21SJ11W-1]|uniref:bifunctional diguanylate cyclase/phosphodiesterase n=1 Tax=Simiduia sp. 21SJ11W-1 TaxID=2909669 RepID=UPI00209EE920|nr:EAL domain-containing protein [Simiduia sp. 21SJ11W-1]UTA47586.1 EAL domain-containing protein [Simiduia sp. 21SJ11W-1]
MSLLRQLVLAITLLVVLLLAGSMTVSVYNARTHFFEQMQVHAQDTATALGFSISQAAQEKDAALIGSMVDVIFDRGYYQRISYSTLEGEPVVVRETALQAGEVPQWFVDLIHIPSPRGESEVIHGWFRLGKIQVVSHTGLAYRDLWRVFTEQLWLFAFTAVLAYGMAGVSLHFLLRPLKKIERQAEAICRREFPEQQREPRAKELRSMVQAMNRMVAKIRDMFSEQIELTESLHRASHVDPVTGLSNRLDFDARLEAFIKSEQGGGEGALLLGQVSQLEQYNQKLGREAGDRLLATIANTLKPILLATPGAIVSRRSGADFCIFVPGIDRLQTEALCEQLMSELAAISWPDGPMPFHLGAVHETSVTLDSQLLSRADAALRTAQHQADANWHLGLQHSRAERPAGEWRNLLRGIIDEGLLQLHFQPVFNRERELLHSEVLVRMDIDGQLQSAGSFLPQVERFALSDALDKSVLTLLAEQPAQGSHAFAVNLSPRSVALPSFREWLKGFLAEHPNLARHLILEVSESVVQSHCQALTHLVQEVGEWGTQVALDHFGVAGSAFNYLQTLPLYCLKVDRSFIAQLHTRQDNQFFVKSLAHIAHSCDMLLLAEGVESEPEWAQAMALGLDGGQGYLLARPAPDLPAGKLHK